MYYVCRFRRFGQEFENNNVKNFTITSGDVNMKSSLADC